MIENRISGERFEVMKPKNLILIEEMDVEVVNRQPTATERSEISEYIARDKEKRKLKTRRAVNMALADKP